MRTRPKKKSVSAQLRQTRKELDMAETRLRLAKVAVQGLQQAVEAEKAKTRKLASVLHVKSHESFNRMEFLQFHVAIDPESIFRCQDAEQVYAYAMQNLMHMFGRKVHENNLRVMQEAIMHGGGRGRKDARMAWLRSEEAFRCGLNYPAAGSCFDVCMSFVENWVNQKEEKR